MEVNISLGQIVLAFVAAMGIPSAIMGLIIWRLERRIDKREKEQAAQEQGQKDLFVLIVQGTMPLLPWGKRLQGPSSTSLTPTATGICTTPSTTPPTSNTSKRTSSPGKAFPP